MSLVKYIKSKPRNVQYSPPGGQVDDDFRLFVDQYQPLTAESVNTGHLAEFTDQQKALYVKYLSLLFHKVYRNFSEPTYGAANYHICRLLHDGFSYTVELWGIQVGKREYKLNDGRVSFNGERMTVASNNGYKFHIVKTNEPYDANKWANPNDPNVVDTYKLTLLRHDDVVERMYCVSLTM